MYAALWRILPGPVWVRALILLVAAIVISLALMEWVFPWAADTLLPQDSIVEGS